MVYLPTFPLYIKHMQVNIPVPWILWESEFKLPSAPQLSWTPSGAPCAALQHFLSATSSRDFHLAWHRGRVTAIWGGRVPMASRPLEGINHRWAGMHFLYESLNVGLFECVFDSSVGKCLAEIQFFPSLLWPFEPSPIGWCYSPDDYDGQKP